MSYVQLNVEVLRLATSFHGTVLCVLMYLASRVDELGTCFPSVKTIVAETHKNETSVYKSLGILEQHNWLIFLRKNERDVITGKPLPNVYMLNPMVFGLRSNVSEKAQNIYKSRGGVVELPTVHNGSLEWGDFHSGGTNQQQNQNQELDTLTRDMTNNNNQQKAPKKRKEQGQEQRAQASNSSIENLPTSNPTAQAQEPRRGAAALRVVGGDAPRFVDPVLVYEPLDEPKEEVVKQLGGIKIASPLARGFIVEYGVTAVQQALQITLSAENITRQGGFFRKILQSKLTTIPTPTPTYKYEQPEEEDEIKTRDREKEDRLFWCNRIKSQTGVVFSENEMSSINLFHVKQSLSTLNDHFRAGYLKHTSETIDIKELLVAIFRVNPDKNVMHQMITDYIRDAKTKIS